MEALGISSQSDHIVGWIEKASESSIYAESWNGTTSGTRIFPDSLLASSYWGGALSWRTNLLKAIGSNRREGGTYGARWKD
ncbi:MAG TPA: hypothetical protein VGR07_14360 [Thermoanaerobaculia bacterium]|jgi:hypothetical protein|nr:hypothetical protein [Thermoanaerobaculia bacterium]